MPRPLIRHAKSLLEMCLYSVAFQLSVREDDQVEDPPNCVHCDCFVNPFERLPSNLLMQIINTLIRNEWLNFKHLVLLVSPHTKILNVSSTAIDDDTTVAHLLQLASARCPQLTNLVMENVEMCRLKYFHRFLPKFKHLQVLNVSQIGKNFNDSCMHILGIYCQDLRELDICLCDVSDDGIEELCGGETDLENEIWEEVKGQCKSLRKLSMTGNIKITPKGMQMALRHLPQLEVLGVWHVIENLAEMHLNDLTRPYPKYALTQLVFRPNYFLFQAFPPYENGALRLAASLCPSVTLVDIRLQAVITDSELLSLTLFENLTELKIFPLNIMDAGIDDGCCITFDGSLAPILKARGNKLKTLHLELPIPVRLGSVIEYCPNLEQLLLDCPHSALADQPATNPSKRLKTAFVWEHLKKLKFPARYGSIPREILLLAFSSAPALKKLSVSHCNTFDDGVLIHAFGRQYFRNLEELILWSCPVSKRAIDRLMTEENVLKKVKFVKCQSLSMEDVADLQKRGEDNNWDLNVTGLDEFY